MSAVKTPDRRALLRSARRLSLEPEILRAAEAERDRLELAAVARGDEFDIEIAKTAKGSALVLPRRLAREELQP